jgi:hypothetical protein
LFETIPVAHDGADCPAPLVVAPADRGLVTETIPFEPSDRS